MDVEVRWSLLKHNSMWVPDGLCSVSVTCQLEVGGGLLILDLVSDTLGASASGSHTEP